ncbi:MAG: hypothetical protein EOO01_04300, partial [Chitinophagaceae bacterium]
KRIVTASFDNTAKVWDALSGELLSTLHHDGQVWGACFSKSGSIATCSMDRTGKIWDANGKLLAILTGHTDFIQSINFTNDGSKLATASYDSTARLWDAKGTMLQVLHHRNVVYAARFSTDGKRLVTASADSTAAVWDVVTGRLLYQLKGHEDQLWSAQFNHNDQFIVTCSMDGAAKLWEAKTGKLLFDLKGHTKAIWDVGFSPDDKKILTASADKTLRVWDVKSGKELLNIPGHANQIRSAMFSPDGKKMLSASNDKTAKIWDATNGKLLQNLKGYTSGLWSIALSPDDKQIVASSGDNTAKVWDIEQGKFLFALKGHTDSINQVMFSPGMDVKGIHPKKILTVSKDRTAKLWDAENGNLLSELKRHTDKIITAQFSPDGKYIATGSDDKTIKLWDADNGVFLSDCIGHSKGIVSVRFSSDGKRLISASKDSTAKIWETSSGKLLFDLTGQKERLLSAEFSPDGEVAVTTSLDSVVHLWDAMTGKLLYSLIDHSGPVSSGKFSPDGQLLVTAGYDGIVRLWEVKTGKLFKKIDAHRSNLRSAEFSGDGKRIITAARDNSSRIFDVATGNLFFSLSDQPGEVEAAIISNRGDKIITAAARTTISVWNAKTASLLYTFFTVGESDHLTVDKDGRYDGTEAARKLLYFTCGTEVISLDQVKDRLWVPNLAERLMHNETINAAKLSDINICGYMPRVEKTRLNYGYRLQITPGTGGLGATVVYINNIEIKRYQAADLKKNGSAYLLDIPADQFKEYYTAGTENKLVVKSYVATNDISSRGTEVTNEARKDKVPPNLYAIMIGVSDYKGAELDLKFAAKDATDMSKAITLSAGKLLGKDHVFVYNLTTASGNTTQPEKKAIRDAFAAIGSRATANDILLIFFAGHGVLEASPGAIAGDKKQFYFLPADASASQLTPTGLKEVGISTEELMEWMKPSKIKAQKRILVLDACNSGSAINQMVDIGKGDYQAARNDDKTQQVKQIDKLSEKAGFYILAASASNQSAYEMSKYNQGILTYCLLKTMKDHPELLEQDKYLNVSGWFNQTVKTVSELVRENNLRQEPQLITTTNFNIGVVDTEVLASINLPEERLLFGSSNFQNSDETIADDDLELSKFINQQLSEVSSRGTPAEISYVTASNAPEAWTLTGRYKITGDEIIVRVNVKQSKLNKHNFEIQAKKSDLRTLAATIVKEATAWIMQTKKSG